METEAGVMGPQAQDTKDRGPHQELGGAGRTPHPPLPGASTALPTPRLRLVAFRTVRT